MSRTGTDLPNLGAQAIGLEAGAVWYPGQGFVYTAYCGTCDATLYTGWEPAECDQVAERHLVGHFDPGGGE